LSHHAARFTSRRARAIELDALTRQDLQPADTAQIPANFDTTTWVTSAVEPCRSRSVVAAPSLHHAIGARGRHIWTDRAQHPQDAGMTVQHLVHVLAIFADARAAPGTAVVSGSITCSQRGKCLGSAPMLRSPSCVAPGGLVAGVSSFAAEAADTGGESSSSSASCSRRSREPLRTLAEDHVVERPHQHA